MTEFQLNVNLSFKYMSSIKRSAIPRGERDKQNYEDRESLVEARTGLLDYIPSDNIGVGYAFKTASERAVVTSVFCR